MNTIKYISVLIITLISLTSFGATYTTLAAGDWSNTTNVWSLDGVTPCGCAPSTITNSDQIIINHDITSNTNITLDNGSSLLIDANGSFTSGSEIIFNNSTATINGDVTVNKFTVNSGSVVDLNNAILTITARVEVYGTINIDGGYTLMTGGNVEVYTGGVLNLENGGKLDVQGGNITNSGNIDLCGTCCTTTSGNWRNNSDGTVSGSGAARSESGNMRNFGNWALTVAWCSAGTQQGMPGFENCFTANITCNLVVLPVEFGEISATVNGDNLIQIDWNTVSERDNDYFILLRREGTSWIEISEVQGAGSTSEAQYYSSLDPSASSGVHYYKVRQVDYNGEYSDSDPVSVELKTADLHVYPNPISANERVNISGIDKGATILLTTTSGTVLEQFEAQDSSMSIDLNTINLRDGIYLITVVNEGDKKTQKLVVQ
ncbi:MAG: T9SS type A sorting domain-containing protein [bacterium]|nr:T9SS type A sorting domain-containing protein [bacterium]